MTADRCIADRWQFAVVSGDVVRTVTAATLPTACCNRNTSW